MLVDNFKLIGKTVLVKGVKALTLGAGATALTVFSKAGLKAVGSMALKDLLK